MSLKGKQSYVSVSAVWCVGKVTTVTSVKVYLWVFVLCRAVCVFFVFDVVGYFVCFVCLF